MGIEQQRLEDAKMADAKHADCKENRSAITSRNCQVLELASPDGNDGAFKRIGRGLDFPQIIRGKLKNCNPPPLEVLLIANILIRSDE